MPIQPSGSRDAHSTSPPEPQGWASQSQRLSFHQGSEGGGGARGPWEEFVSNPPKAAHVALAAPHSARFGNRTNYNMEAAALFALGGVRRGEKVVLVGSHWHYLDILRRVEDLLKAQPPGTVQPSWRKRDIAVFEASGVGSEFFVDGMPDPERFESFLRKAAGPRGRPIRVWNNLGELLHESGSRRASRAVDRIQSTRRPESGGRNGGRGEELSRGLRVRSEIGRRPRTPGDADARTATADRGDPGPGAARPLGRLRVPRGRTGPGDGVRESGPRARRQGRRAPPLRGRRSVPRTSGARRAFEGPRRRRARAVLDRRADRKSTRLNSSHSQISY